MQLSRLTLGELCRRQGGMLKLPAGLEGPKLLWAIAGVESSFGADIAPRHEAAYCHGGKYFDASRTRIWGCLAHCSYGPWQILHANLNPGVSPMDLLRTPELTAGAVVMLIQNRIVGKEGATTVEQIADAYNSGDWRDRIVPAQYIADLARVYREVPVGALA